MRIGLATVSVILLTGLPSRAADPPNVETVVKGILESFEPVWSPPRGQLRGWVIAIDPALTSGSRPDDRLRDDLGLLTAGYLYHFVIGAGGTPVLTRADGTRSAAGSRSSGAERMEILRRAGCHLCISIRYTRDAEAFVSGGADDVREDDARLADALRGTVGAAALEAPAALIEGRDLSPALRAARGATNLALCEVSLTCPRDNDVIDAAVRQACFENARRLYGGLHRFCTKRLDRAEPDAGPDPIPDTPTSKTSNSLRRLARSIWPEGRLPEERLDWFCRRYTEIAVTNPTLVFFEVTANVEDDAVALRGRTNAPRVVTGLKHALRAVGVRKTRDEVRALPDRERLGELLFGVCRAATALTYARSGPDGGLQTQLLFGEPLFLLDREADHYLLQAGDGYWGWVRCEAVEEMTAEQFDGYMQLRRAVALREIDARDVRIPRGSELRVVRMAGDERIVLLPGGSTATVPAETVQMQDPDGAEAASRVRAALELLYVPYVFGGRSPLGMDCSGLVTNVWARVGEKPPRDAWQQALAGRLVATRWHRNGIRAGDQVFLLNEQGKIQHTGVALDATHVIHSSPPCVQIGSIDPEDRLYNSYLGRNFFIVKRP